MKSKNNDINSLSEILLRELAARPELLATIKTQKGAGENPVPRKRITMKERIERTRQRYYYLGSKIIQQ